MLTPFSAWVCPIIESPDSADKDCFHNVTYPCRHGLFAHKIGGEIDDEGENHKDGGDGKSHLKFPCSLA